MTGRNKVPSTCYPATRQDERTLVELLEQGERSGVSRRTILDILAAVQADRQAVRLLSAPIRRPETS
ncbi:MULTISPECIES: hypothetical protein [Acetobacter]|uniref:Ribbon-helix-helix protein CopG domain-containing protein n=3 Tax=Acetobacter TaxID=434 RepID=A0ABX0JLZ5_9PROT|nr:MULTISPECIES: hypothetical protein [Acetobacter]MBB3882072.1 hypothetical protein [Acetobacter oeni]NHN83832.1 hypothetical protein [Acetobacter musti]NHN89923.1 hypothetical protein [Acetobacter conturbans]NHN93343.1 hypothetical protein [Acetobacter sicerae]NHO17612.1 hypothetical protein [Acetobacter oeni]